MMEEAPLVVDGRKVDVVIAGDDGDFDRACDAVEQRARLVVLALEGEVGYVPGDDDVISASSGRCEHGAQVLAAVHAPAAQEEVGLAGEALVEEQVAPLDAAGREDVSIGDVGDAQHQRGIRPPV